MTPHHLFLTEADAARLGALGDMRPLLGTADDVAALWSHLNDTVDCIATDHAPHTLAEKGSANPPPGVPGLETSLPLMLSAVQDGRVTVERLTALMHDNPRRIYDLPAQPETWVEVEMTPYEIPEDVYKRQMRLNRAASPTPGRGGSSSPGAPPRRRSSSVRARSTSAAGRSAATIRLRWSPSPTSAACLSAGLPPRRLACPLPVAWASVPTACRRARRAT